MKAESFIKHVLRHVAPRGAVTWSSKPQSARHRECATILHYDMPMTVSLACKLASTMRRAIRHDLLARKVHHFCRLPCHTGLGALTLRRDVAGMSFRATLRKDCHNYVLVIDWLTDEPLSLDVVEPPRHNRRSKP